LTEIGNGGPGQAVEMGGGYCVKGLDLVSDEPKGWRFNRGLFQFGGLSGFETGEHNSGCDCCGVLHEFVDLPTGKVYFVNRAYRETLMAGVGIGEWTTMITPHYPNLYLGVELSEEEASVEASEFLFNSYGAMMTAWCDEVVKMGESWREGVESDEEEEEGEEGEEGEEEEEEEGNEEEGEEGNEVEEEEEGSEEENA